MEYWKECLEIALEELEIKLTDDQVDYLANAVAGGHENYDMAFGHDVASANWESDESKELKLLKDEIESKRQWELSTKPCPNCLTTGIVKDVWGRDRTCQRCDGKGRI